MHCVIDNCDSFAKQLKMDFWTAAFERIRSHYIYFSPVQIDILTDLFKY